jgi:hypothetical protein
MSKDFGSTAFQNKENNNSNQDNPQLEAVGADQIFQLNPVLNAPRSLVGATAENQQALGFHLNGNRKSNKLAHGHGPTP